MDQLKGRWVIDKALSTGTEGILKLQGVPWALRKAVNLVTITLDIGIYPKTTETTQTTTPPPTVIEIQVTPTGGLPGTKEIRILDWSELEQTDFAFGTTKHATGFVKGSAGNLGNVYPDIEMKREAGSEKAKRFLRGEILEDGTPSKWFVPSSPADGGAGEEAVWVHTFIRSVPEKWTVEQVWGFEEVDGNVCHARRFVAVDKKGDYVLGRALYKKLDGGA
ncbi:hypothetical protein BJY01DRAFT_263356 [Aspergillus pseudoustus]|uniref:Calycin-like protein n=1 Tax=Aspergillus pseudoustus TaxID=1810923 RepID=A0ABR4K323_9EURO